MKKYFLHGNGQQLGPFDKEELRQKNISPTTPVWFEGMAEWMPAQQVPELQSLFSTSAPPPFTGFGQQQQQQQQQPQQTYHYTAPSSRPSATNTAANTNTTTPPKKKSNTALIVSIAVLVLVVILGTIAVNNPNVIPGVKLEINTPKPTVVTSRANQGKSGLLNARTTVYATVMNQGGDGNVLVTFYVYQGGNTYDRSQSIYMRAGESQDLEETFEEVDFISGDITYDVSAQAQ